MLDSVGPESRGEKTKNPRFAAGVLEVKERIVYSRLATTTTSGDQAKAQEGHDRFTQAINALRGEG
jgi:hypothetical protein